MANAKRDSNRVPTLIGVSSSDQTTPVLAEIDPATGRLLVNTSVSIATITDIEDGAGDSVMDATNNALQISIVNDDVGIGGGTQYDEDAQHSSGDTGTMALTVRNDTLAALATTDGDYAPLQVDSDGALYVNVAAGSSAGTEFTAGDDTYLEATSAGPMVLAVRNDTLATLADTDNEFAPLQVNSSGALYIDVANGGVLESLVDGIEAVLGTIDADTGTLAGAVSGGQFQVDIVADGADLLTNTNFAAAFGTAGSADSQVLSIQGIASMTPVIVDLGSNNDVTLATLPDTSSGDLAAITTATEAIQAAVEGTLTVGSHAVTNAGTFAVQVDGSALTALQLIDDIVYVDDADWTDGSSKHALVGGLYQSSPQTVTDGDVAPFNITVNGALHVSQQGTVSIQEASALDVSAATVTIEGTVTANLSATDNAVLDQIELNTDDLLTTTDFNAAFGTAGSADSQVLSIQGIASMTPVVVDLGSNNDVTLATLPDTASGDLAAINTSTDGIETLLGTIDTDTGNIATSVGVMDDWDNAASDGASVSGDVAHDSSDAGEPVKIGGKAKSPDGTDPSSVAEDDRTDSYFDLNGRQFVNTHHPRSVYKHLDGSTAYTDESLFADPGDGFQTVITSIVVASGEATAMNFFLEEGSTKIFGPIYLEAVAGRGFVSGPIYLPVTASTAVTITTSASIQQSINVSGYIQAV